MSGEKPYILYTNSYRYNDVIVDANKIILYVRYDTRWISTSVNSGCPECRMHGENTYTSITPLSEEELFLELL